MWPKLKADAHILCFCHWRTEFSDHSFHAALASAGYEIRGVLSWVKNQQGTGDLTGSFAPKQEWIIHAVKGNPCLYKRVPDVLFADRVTKTTHPTDKPVELLTQLIEPLTVEGQLVVDPFAGVASTLVAAKQTGRAFWGCELDAEYFREGSVRL